MISDFATIDYETYYDREFSLSKLQTDEYILHEQFEVIGVAVKPSTSAPTQWFSGTHEETKEWLSNMLDWPNTAVCAHNTHFDGFITTQVFGLKPKLWMDTVPMARMRYPYLKSHSLANVAEKMGKGVKGSEVINAMGLRRVMFGENSLRRYADYCINDVELTHAIATGLLPWTPNLELYLIDMTTRMFTEPKLHGDSAALTAYYNAELQRKDDLLEECGVTKEELMSNPKMADVLRLLGVTPPTKISARTGKEAYAFAKSDKAFTALLDHWNPEVQAVVAARLGVKSTIAETRTLRLIDASKRGPLPVHLNHWGAKTTGRLSGGNKMNWQNIPARGPGSAIRKALRAPPGHKVVVGDSSNIELRVVMALSGNNSALDMIARGDDLYCDFATRFYGRVITKKDKAERMLGKVAMLSLQYGAGDAKFAEMARLMTGTPLEPEEASRIVAFYRYLYKPIVKLWRHCENVVLPAVLNRSVMQAVDVNGWVLTTHDGFGVPGCPGVVYHKLARDAETLEWSYQSASGPTKLYGGKVVENLCQHVARHIVMWQTARLHRKYPVALSVHDEIVCVVPDEQVEDCRRYMEECLTTAPSWCAGLPLACETEVGESYGDAK